MVLRSSTLLVMLLACAVSAAAAADATQADPPERSDAKRAVSSNPPAAPIYKPPARGKPRARIGGGVRGTRSNWPALYALVPEHTGRTVSAQPSLFWYVNAPVPEGAPLVFTLFDETTVEPLIEAELPRPERAGIQHVDLARHGVALEPDVEYEWTVALVVNPEHRSSDIVAAGWIDRIGGAPGLPPADGEADARIYAEQGLWYDALAAASAAIEADPTDPALRASRDALLRQVGLDVAVGIPSN
jgi:hypothetical protein